MAIAFGLPREMPVRLYVYDVLGRRVRTLVDEDLKGGEYRMAWDRQGDRNREMASGIYFLRFEAGEYRRMEKLVLVK